MSTPTEYLDQPSVRKRKEKAASVSDHNRSLCMYTVAAQGYSHQDLPHGGWQGTVAYREGLRPSP